MFNHVGRSHPRLREAVAAGAGLAGCRLVRDRPRAPAVDGLEVHVFEGHERPRRARTTTTPRSGRPSATSWRTGCERGVDGWRLDAAYAVPASFWRAPSLPRVRERFPDAWFVGEVIHGDYAGYVAESGLDSVTQYELWKAICNSIEERQPVRAGLVARSGTTSSLAAFLPLTFLGNHDVTRMASRRSPTQRHLAHAIAVLFSVGGTPAVYYGDEQGSTA